MFFPKPIKIFLAGKWKSIIFSKEEQFFPEPTEIHLACYLILTLEDNFGQYKMDLAKYKNPFCWCQEKLDSHN